MLPKIQRIPRKMVPLIANGAKVFKNNVFLLKFVQYQESASRFCFSVSKKVSKSAVIRNKLRRAGYREIKKYIPYIKPNILAIFSFRTIPKGDREIVENLGIILKESNLIKDNDSLL